MDGLYNESNSTYCLNVSDILKPITDLELKSLMIFSIISVPLLLVPTLILQLFFICRYKSTFLHRQFLYTTFIIILLNATYIAYSSTLDDDGCLLFSLYMYILNWYLWYVQMIQMTTIHLLLLYKLCKHMETRIMQRLQTLCCNIRPRLSHDVIIVCIQFGLPLPLLIADIVKTQMLSVFLYKEIQFILLPLVAVNILLGLICIVLLVLWFCILWKRKLLKSKAKFVCTQIGHILIVLVVLLIGNTTYFTTYFFSYFFLHYYLIAIRTVVTVSFGVYILMSLPSLQRKVTKKAQVFATNLHTNPTSTRVSLPTDTAEHALSPSTAEPSEVTLLIN